MNRHYLLLRSLIVCLCMVVGYALQAQIIYVTPNGAGNQSGSSWSNAAPGSQLQTMINAAAAGSQVWVASGEYLPAQGQSFSMKEGVRIYGGFPASGTPAFIDRNFTLNVTTLKGNGASVVRNESNGLSNAALLDGFTITGANTADFGAGIRNISVSPQFSNLIITGNHSSTHYAGVYNSGGSPLFTNSLISNNRAEYQGGGMGNNNASPTLTNVAMVGNYGGSYGGAMSNNGNSLITMINTTIANNTTGYNISGAIHTYLGANMNIVNSIIYGNNYGGIIGDNDATVTVQYSLVQGMGADNINHNLDGNTDPLFINASAGDIRLRIHSPVINKGNNSVNSISSDIYGNPRIVNNTIDIGAYEYQQCNIPGSVLYVDNNTATPGDGTSWNKPLRELSEALTYANSCNTINTILVAKGTYRPTDNTNRDSAFAILRGGLKIYGGYPSGGGTRNPAINPTILSGDIGTVNDNNDNSYHVLVVAGISGSDSVVVDGFTITGGKANGTGSKQYNGVTIVQGEGAGIYLHSNNTIAGKLAIRNCVSTGNAATNYGAGFYSQLSSASITNCVIASNTANSGAGMFNYNVSAPAVTNCLFVNNTASNYGGAMLNQSSTPVIVNCTFYGNTSPNGAGAIGNSTATPVVTNSIIWGNNSGISNGTTNITYSYVQGGVSGTGNLNTDPFFVNSADADGPDNIWGTADDGLNIKCSSAAINGGINSAVTTVTTDITGNSRIQQSTVDMGAYESPYVIPPVPSVEIAASVSGSICAGTEVTFTATSVNGGSSPAYQWKKNNVIVGNNSATYTINNLADGDKITLQLTSSESCVYSATANDTLQVTVNAAPAKPIIAASGATTFCEGGSVTLSAPAGFASYLWSNGATAQSINVTESGSFSVIVTNSNGCSSVSSDATAVTVNTLPAKPIVTASGATTFCEGGNLTLSAPAGFTSYLWSYGATTQSITVNQTGSYSVTVINSNGCSSESSDATTVTLNALPAKPIVTASGATTFCTGGSVTLSAPAGFAYLWSNGAATQSINITEGGSYSVIITNSNGCSSESSDATTVTVNALPAKPIITESGATTFCEGGNLTLSAPAGFTSYLWSNGATTQSITVNQTGSYSVIVSNSNGCSSVFSDATAVTVNALPAKPIVTASGATTFCTGGSVTLSAPSGFASYLWSNGATTQSITVNQTGSYSVIVSNSNGCSSVSSDATAVTVNALPAKPIVTASGATTFCEGGSVTLSAPGGFATYMWSNGATTQSINVAETGTYSVVAGSGKGCTSLASDATTVTVNALPAKPMVTASGATTFCEGGSVTLSATSGFASYLWSNGATTQSITVNQTGSYSVTVTNSNGCSSVSSDATVVTVNIVPAKPIVTASGATTFCTGGGVTLSAPAGFTSYLWSNGATTKSTTVNQSGSYTVIVGNVGGCVSLISDATTVTVNTIPAKPIISTSGPLSFPQGGTVTLSAPSGFASYQWSNGAITSSITVNASGTFTVIVRNSNGCSSPASNPVTVTVQAVVATLSVSHFDADYGQLTNNQVRPYLQLNNEGSTPVAYKDLTVRYWLTVEDFAPMTNLAVDWAQLGTNKVKMKYVKLGQPRNGAFGYIEYTFEASAGNLAGNSNSGPIQSRAAKSNWTNFNEADDYSYASSTTYKKNSKITLYRNGTLVWGTEPTIIAPMQSLKGLSQDKSNGTTTNTISNWVKLNNNGNQPVAYKDISIRYWFTEDGNKTLNYYMDYAELGNNYVKGKFVKMSPSLSNADTYLELSFTAPDSLYPISTTGNIQQRISKSNWSNFNQSDDHSYKPGQTMTENIKMTVYVKGVLVYGTEPSGNMMARANSLEIIKAGSAPEITTGLVITVINNPIKGDEAEFIIRGAEGKNVQVTITDAKGRIISSLQAKKISGAEHRRLSLHNSAAGILYLRVIAGAEVKTVSLLKVN